MKIAIIGIGGVGGYYGGKLALKREDKQKWNHLRDMLLKSARN